jgi:hypothetical protein
LIPLRAALAIPTSPVWNIAGGNCNLKLTRNDLMTNMRLSTTRHAVLGPDAFNSFLQIETRRAIRARKSLVLLLLDVVGTQDLNHVVSRLSSCVRATDYIGWHEAGERLGIVFTEVESEQRDCIARLLTAKIATILRGTINPCLSEQITITILPSGNSYLVATTGTV